MSTSPGTRPSSGSILAALIAIIVFVGLAVMVVANGPQIVRSFFPPEPETAEGHAIFDLYTIVFVIAAIIFFLVEGLIVWTVIRYRRRPGDDELPPQTHGHNLAEVVWTVIPTIIVLFLFFISWQTLNTVEATSATPDLKVRAVAGQFQWSFEYLAPEAGALDKPLFTVNVPTGADGGLTLPAGKTTHLYLYSPDVIHAFYVPQFLFKRDVVPFADATRNQFDLKLDADTADQTFRGQCAELCGTGHRIMVFEVHSLSPAKFQAWYDQKLAQAAASPTPPPSGGAGGPVIDLTAQAVKFDRSELQAPANQPFTIHFDNKDQGTPHDVDILDANGGKLFDGQVFQGPAVQDYGVKPLGPGSYKFECSVHPTLMFGTLTVQ
ncbi:MAG TPA: cupredoxin domain-containing protein [Candidatus Limnocylindrales bacterium]|jgi:cytochrome c oxidase subunit 2|nr:cupredoxin domain-containing protein [Candidatus Limnocylindrales bacterium]